MTRTSPHIRSATSVAAVLASAALLAAPANADTNNGEENGLTYMSNAVATAGSQSPAPEVTCPAGTSVVGIGADSVSTSLGGLLNTLQPIDGPDGDTRSDDGAKAWTYNTTASMGQAIVWAVCAPGKVIYRSKSVGMKVNKPATAKARCPDGSRVVGGGNYITGASQQAQIQALRSFDGSDSDKKPDDGWRVGAYNLLDTNKDLTAFAFCRKNAVPKYSGGFGSTSPGVAGGGGANCNDLGQSVSGPGAQIKGEPSLLRLTAITPGDVGDPFEAGAVPDDYVLTQVENNTTGDARFGSFAACLALP